MNRFESIKLSQELLTYYLTRFNYQRDVIDRWFRFYLIIIGTPIPIIVALIPNHFDIYNNDYVHIIISLFFIIGLIFFIMNIKQRINSVRFENIRMKILEDNILLKLKLKLKSFPRSEYGADFCVSLIYMVVNSFWFSLEISIVFHKYGKTYENSLFLFIYILIFIVQYYLRYHLLKKSKTSL